MSRYCQYSSEIIAACNKHASRYEVSLRGEMAMGIPTEMASIEKRIHDLKGNTKDLKHVIDQLNYDLQLTENLIKEEETRQDKVQYREPKRRSGAPQMISTV